jgi:hypothetical protein
LVRVCVYVFIEMSAHTYMSIYVCTVFLKKLSHVINTFPTVDKLEYQIRGFQGLVKARAIVK